MRAPYVVSMSRALDPMAWDARGSPAVSRPSVGAPLIRPLNRSFTCQVAKLTNLSKSFTRGAPLSISVCSLCPGDPHWDPDQALDLP